MLKALKVGLYVMS